MLFVTMEKSVMETLHNYIFMLCNVPTGAKTHLGFALFLTLKKFGIEKVIQNCTWSSDLCVLYALRAIFLEANIY